MVQATLATEIENMIPSNVESEAAAVLTDAYGVFASDAIGNTIPISSAGVELGKVAMSSALIGMSAPNAGITIIPAAILAFWVAVCGGFAVSFVGSVAAIPPPHASLSSAFASLMVTNKDANLSLSDAAEQMAVIMYADAIVGGTVTIPPAVVGPIL